MAGCNGEPMTRFLLAAFGAVVLSGCGAFGGSSFCDFRQGSSNGPEPRCQERVNTISAEVFKGACTAAGGMPSSGTCPREGVVAGCFIGTQGDGSKVNDWYYAPKTRADVVRVRQRPVPRAVISPGSPPTSR